MLHVLNRIHPGRGLLHSYMLNQGIMLRVIAITN